MKGLGVWSGGLRRHPDAAAVAEAAAELEALGYAALFIPGGRGGDDLFPAVAHLLAATSEIPVATGVINIWMHEAEEVAAAYADLERRHPGRFVAGLGVSHAALVDRDQPGRYRRPLARMGAYLDRLDGADPPVPVSRRLIGALGPKATDLARDRAAGIHPYFVPVEHTRRARARLGPGPLLAVEQAVVLDPEPESARATARAHMQVYLGLPNYLVNLARCGFTEADAEHGGSDRLVDGIVAWGDEAAVAERIEAHREAGADLVCIQVLGPEVQGLPLEQWRRLVELT